MWQRNFADSIDGSFLMLSKQLWRGNMA